MCRNQVVVRAASPPNSSNTRNFRDIIQHSGTHGFKVQCKECECFLVECDDCGNKMCDCLPNRQNRLFFNRRNPFSSSNRDEDEDREKTCAKCFLNRDDPVLEHIMELGIDDSYLEGRGYVSIYDDPYIKEKYENYFVNNSGHEYPSDNFGNDYREFPDYEDFISYFTMLRDNEIHQEHWEIENTLNQSFPAQPSWENDVVQDIYQHLFESNINSYNLDNIPINTETNNYTRIQNQLNQLNQLNQQSPNHREP